MQPPAQWRWPRWRRGSSKSPLHSPHYSTYSWLCTSKLFRCTGDKILPIKAFPTATWEENPPLIEQLLEKPETIRDLGKTVLWTEQISCWQLRSHILSKQASHTCRNIICKTTGPNHYSQLPDQLLRGEAGLGCTQNTYTRISKPHSKSLRTPRYIFLA